MRNSMYDSWLRKCLRKAYVNHVFLHESSCLTWIKLSYVNHIVLRESVEPTYGIIVLSKTDVSHAILRESSCLMLVKLSYVSQVSLRESRNLTYSTCVWCTSRQLFLPRGIICSHFVRQMYQSWESSTLLMVDTWRFLVFKLGRTFLIPVLMGGCRNSFLVFVSDSSKFRLAENLV